MRFRKIIQLFNKGNVCVTGLCGTGKDMLFSNVIARRKSPYVSNIDYGGYYLKLDFEAIDCGKNTWQDFMSGNVKPYVYPYPNNAHVFLSDAGVYTPAQYCNELNKKYPYLATFQALIRHVSYGGAWFHTNCQNLNRVYDKIREMSDTYIRCTFCKVLFGGRVVLQRVTLYDKYESCLNRVKPCRIRVPWRDKEAQMSARIYRDNFYNQHGTVKTRWLIYRNKSKYNTHHFGDLLMNA